MQVSGSQSEPAKIDFSALAEAQHLAWIQRTFEEVLKVLGWPEYIPPADTSFFKTTQLVFELIAQLANSKRNLAKLNYIFLNELHPIDYQCIYPAEIYFIAMRLTQKNRLENDDWLVSSYPQKETLDLAVSLISNTSILLESLRNQNQETFKNVFPHFDQAWSDFLDQLIKEKTKYGYCWCGTFMLSDTLNKLKNDSIYLKREQKIRELSSQIHLNEDTKCLLPSINAEILSIMFKKTHHVHSLVCATLITELVAAYLLKLTKDEVIKKILDEIIQTHEIVFVDLILQLTGFLGGSTPILKCVKDQVAEVQTKIYELKTKHPKTAHESILKRILENHIHLTHKDYVIKNKDSKNLNQDIAASRIEDFLNAICLGFYFNHKKEMETIIKSILLDYRLIHVKPEIRIAGLAHQIIDLGLKTFEPKSFFAGYTKEITLLERKRELDKKDKATAKLTSTSQS